MPSRFKTFQRTLAACEQGESEAWRTFLEAYTPVAFGLVDFFLPAFRGRREEIWREALQTLSTNNYERLRGFDHQAEREFLVDLRSFLMEMGAPRLDRARDISGSPRPSPETLGALLQDLPLLYQEAVFLKLAGFSDATLEKVLRIPAAAAERACERLQSDYSAFLKQDRDECLWPAAWLELLRQVRAAGSPQCVPIRQFVRIFDGQASWYDKAPTEEHIVGCLHCLERWTSLREVIYWRNSTKPLPAGKVENLLSSLPIEVPASRKSLLGRLFG